MPKEVKRVLGYRIRVRRGILQTGRWRILAKQGRVYAIRNGKIVKGLVTVTYAKRIADET